MNIIEAANTIKQRISTADVAQRYGLAPNRAGFVRCPFHSGDHTASMIIYKDMRRGWTCFGCHAGGTVIDFKMRIDGISFADAVRALDDEYNLHLLQVHKETMFGQFDRLKSKALFRQRNKVIAECWRDIVLLDWLNHLQYEDAFTEANRIRPSQRTADDWWRLAESKYYLTHSQMDINEDERRYMDAKRLDT